MEERIESDSIENLIDDLENCKDEKEELQDKLDEIHDIVTDRVMDDEKKVDDIRAVFERRNY